MDIPNKEINDVNQLEFAILCIENVAAALNVDPKLVYQAFTENSDIRNSKPELQL